ncbi:uroporphyrinogen-III synthase [Arvimicrobium flavum]|uniref:uroporphyrinogen-III synthase n=1 Tax=Arvimicrobium flavum TaxID=3393320 RepID=UPI00237A5B42|nr:uroporphyrinogen-III synthase [Mesorhizobium shangrilense]
MGVRVLVTRPEPGASRTAGNLVAAGFEPVRLPLTRIEPLEQADIGDPRVSAVAITSANAVRHASSTLLASVNHLPCFAVGEETGDAARRSGFADVRVSGGNAPALARMIAMDRGAGARIAYLCGRLRRPTFETSLAVARILVTSIETYDTLAIDYTPDEFHAHVGSQPVPFVLLYSAEAAIAFIRLINSIAEHRALAHARLVCISRRVGAVFAGEGHEIVVAPEPTEASMLSTLRDISSAAS